MNKFNGEILCQVWKFELFSGFCHVTKPPTKSYDEYSRQVKYGSPPPGLFAGWLGFGEDMFLFLPFAFLDSVQQGGNNLFDVKNDDARI